MTETVLIAGTASHVGKSTIAAGLCRHLADRGHSVAPYKAQNMSNNARVAITPAGAWGEIGISQHVQARAARSAPTTDMNPVLLKPQGDGESQLVIQGRAVADLSAAHYYEKYWEEAREAAIESYERLASNHDVIVAEGAGSIAEINLHERDLANVETAAFADANILVAVDIERGGAFASLYGTLELMPEECRDQVVGAVITKFRGDRALLRDGIATIESKTDVPVLGVIPYDDPGLPEEDTLGLPADGERALLGTDDGVPPEQAVRIAVPRFPRISNTADLDPLAREPGVRVAVVPPAESLTEMDGVLLPGSKNTVDDLRALREAGFGHQLAAFDGPIVGICGGYQMLGERITNAAFESTAEIEAIDGFGLLPVETAFQQSKHVERVTTDIEGYGPLSGATGTVTGYEIHMGRSRQTAPVESPVGEQSAATTTVVGTYLHGLFENDAPRHAFCNSVFEAAGLSRPGAESQRVPPSDTAATLVGEHVDIDELGF